MAHHRQASSHLSLSEMAQTQPEKLSKKDVAILHNVREYLELNYLDELSLNAIIKQFGLNAFKLKYGFKALFNTSVMRFVDDKKMDYARQMLLHPSDQDMVDIADRLGYNHYSNFSIAFKRRFGCAPTRVKHIMMDN